MVPIESRPSRAEPIGQAVNFLRHDWIRSPADIITLTSSNSPSTVLPDFTSLPEETAGSCVSLRPLTKALRYEASITYGFSVNTHRRTYRSIYSENISRRKTSAETEALTSANYLRDSVKVATKLHSLI